MITSRSISTTVRAGVVPEKNENAGMGGEWYSVIKPKADAKSCGHQRQI